MHIISWNTPGEANGKGEEAWRQNAGHQPAFGEDETQNAGAVPKGGGIQGDATTMNAAERSSVKTTPHVLDFRRTCIRCRLVCICTARPELGSKLAPELEDVELADLDAGVCKNLFLSR